MYFIARNNMIYNYIAHTSLRRRYAATVVALCALLFVGMYVLYYPLLAHSALLRSECQMLQKKYDEIMQWDKNSYELSGIVASSKQNIGDHAISSDKREEQCHKKIVFVLDTIAQLHLQLITYGSYKEKDKKWYIKDSAHFDISGSLQKLLIFLETIKKSKMMITVSNVAIIRIVDDTFQMSFDLGLITIKK